MPQTPLKPAARPANHLMVVVFVFVNGGESFNSLIQYFIFSLDLISDMSSWF